MSNFAGLGLSEHLCKVILKCGWTEPTEIQKECIPLALNGKDLVGLAEAGSGKTAAYLLPIMESILKKPRLDVALILVPTRELAVQVVEQCQIFGDEFGLRAISLVGGQSADIQASELKKQRRHIIVGTPGRVAYHLTKTKALHVDKTKFLVIDEADQMLSENFEAEMSIIMELINAKRRTFLFSATMCESVHKLEKYCTNPKTVRVAKKYDKAKRLDHAFVFLPDDARDLYSFHLLKSSGVSRTSHKAIVFANTWRDSFRLASVMNQLLSDAHQPDERVAIFIHGRMSQLERQEALNDFKQGNVCVLVATDLAARGLDIPNVDLVINYDLPIRPTNSDCVKAYVHRIGRTARASRVGRAISLVTPYSATHLKMIEHAMEQEVPQLPWQPQAIENAAALAARIAAINENMKSELREECQSKAEKLQKRRKKKTKAGKPAKKAKHE